MTARASNGPRKKDRSGYGTGPDPFTTEIVRSYLQSSVRIMAETTRRTAYSTLFSEGLDFTCAIFDSNGRMVAQALGMPLHAGTLHDTVQNIIKTYVDFEEGDVILQNDPYNGGSHQGDVAVVSPIFHDRELVGFAINRGHWTDVGGMSPGGWSGTARDVVQEALLIPPVKLYKGGTLSREVRDLILRNVRMAKQCWGDIQAQVASNIAAERRFKALIDKYGLTLVRDAMEDAIRYSRRRFTALLDQLPDGAWHGEEFYEDDGHGGGPYRINVTATKKGRKLVIDFAGTDAQARGPINATLTVTKASAYSAVMATVDPGAPLLNAGVLDMIEVRAPIGTIVNPVYPAPVYCCTSDPCHRIFEGVLKALGQAAHHRMTAGTYCSGNCVTAAGTDPESGDEFLWYEFECGGCGARPNKDGNNVEWALMGNLMTESMEVWETRYPVRFERYEMITDSGGAGKYRGGLGVSRQLNHLADTTFTTAFGDRHVIAPWGLEGGKEGRPNSFTVIRGGVEMDFPTMFGTSSPAKFSLIPLKAGDILDVSAGGGGGYSNPLERDPAMVELDVLYEYVSTAAAREQYGVVIDPETGKADARQTEALRKQMRD